MDDAGIERTLTDCERALASEAKPDLTRLGFWKAVAVVKRRPDLVDRYAERIARIDREAFLRAVPLAFPAGVGVALDVVGTIAGLAILGLAPSLPAPWREVAFLAATGALVGATHGLAHYLVGGGMGIRFTHWFSAPPKRPQPGFKTDYASYLRTPARSRAWMHASGAIVSKLVPFLVLPVAFAAGAETWTVWALVAIGVGQLFTDALFSTRASDWKRFRREMRAGG